MKLDLPYPPSLNNAYATVRGRRVKSAEARRYATMVGLLAKTQGAKLIDGPVSVALDFYRPRKAGDLDNMLKVLLDSLTGIVWVDDEQIIEVTARRFDDKRRPRVEMNVIEAAP